LADDDLDRAVWRMLRRRAERGQPMPPYDWETLRFVVHVIAVLKQPC
jgi:hypothetical protein